MRKTLLVSTAVLLLGASPVCAATPLTAEDMQKQIDMLNAKIDSLSNVVKSQQQIISSLQSQAEVHPSIQQDETSKILRAPASIPSTVANSSPPSIDKENDKIKVTVGGFVESAGIYRSRNEAADVGSSFNTGIAFPNQALYHEHEFRGSARQSRLSLLTEGNATPDMKLGAYFEGDFLGAAPTSNSLESNSYTPRLRQAYVSIDRSDWGMHFLTGQAWSLATLYHSGLSPRQENLPLTIDAQYVPGFNWTRNWQARAVKDFDTKKIALGMSIEGPQANIYSGPNAPSGITNFSNGGGSGYVSTVNYSDDIAPDVIVKLAADPGLGHYEVYGLGRFITDRSFGQNNTIFAGGVGGGAVLPIIDKKLDVQVSVLAGRGVGRYGSAQLPDATIKPNGSLSPIDEFETLVGVVGHPNPAWDIYVYGGTERARRNDFVSGGKGFGYGSPLYNNAGCSVEGDIAATCVANTSAITQVTGGAWWKFYQGNMGLMKVGLQNSYTWRNIFAGVGGNPSTNDDITMVSFRYYPF